MGHVLTNSVHKVCGCVNVLLKCFTKKKFNAKDPSLPPTVAFAGNQKHGFFLCDLLIKLESQAPSVNIFKLDFSIKAAFEAFLSLFGTRRFKNEPNTKLMTGKVNRTDHIVKMHSFDLVPLTCTIHSGSFHTQTHKNCSGTAGSTKQRAQSVTSPPN